MFSYSKKIKLLAFLFVTLVQTAKADENNWPQLDKSSDAGICEDALKMANSAYYSDNFYLYEPQAIHQDVRSNPMLQPALADISAGDALVANTSVFKKILKNNQDDKFQGNIYWQVKANYGLRYVVVEEAFNWRGNRYTLLVVKEDITTDEFLESYEGGTKQIDSTSLIEERWQPPLIMQENTTNNLWTIDMGEPYVFLSDWRIYSIAKDGAKQLCTIHFHAPVKRERELLPVPVQKLAVLLDGTLGSGKNEGTLNPTAGIKINVMHTWANVAMRPWAVLKSKPYNSREQVDLELKKWSGQAKSFHKLYQDIYLQYPKAERELAKYYKTNFNKNTAEAEAMAKQNLDIAFRTYFVFSK